MNQIIADLTNQRRLAVDEHYRVLQEIAKRQTRANELAEEIASLTQAIAILDQAIV